MQYNSAQYKNLQKTGFKAKTFQKSVHVCVDGNVGVCAHACVCL